MASISFHFDTASGSCSASASRCRPSCEITQAQREQRVAACLDDKGHDVSDQRAKCPVRDDAETVLEKLRDGKAGEVYDRASPVFRSQSTRDRFVQLQDEYTRALGKYIRLLGVTEAKVIGGTSATFDVLAEFEQVRGRARRVRFRARLEDRQPGSCAASSSWCRCRAPSKTRCSTRRRLETRPAHEPSHHAGVTARALNAELAGGRSTFLTARS